MSAKSRFANETLNLLVVVLMLLTSVPMSTPVVAADDGPSASDAAQADAPAQEQPPEPGIHLYAVCDPAVAEPGAQAACTVTVSNEDIEDATDLKLSAHLPKGLSPVGDTSRSWDATVEDLAMGESVALELALEVDDDASGPLSFEIEAHGKGEVRATVTAIVGVESTDGSTDEPIGADGGQFDGKDGRIHVHFPPGALKKEAKVKAQVHKQEIDPRGQAKDKVNAASDRTGALLRFSLEAQDAATGEDVHQFDSPVTLEIDLRGLLTKEGLLPGQHLYLIHIVDSETGEAEDVDFEYDPETGVMTAELEHFSDYGTGVIGEGWQPMTILPVADKFSGAASYSYPIAVPAGRNGLQPNLTISYSSRRLDGLLGGQGKLDSAPLPLGWSVGGVPEIVRSTDREAIAFVLKDYYTLSLNGTSHELKPANPNQTCGQYFVENAPGIYVERFNNSAGCGNGSGYNDTSDYWIVRTPDGTEYRMGYTANSEVSVYDSQGRTICDGYCSGIGGYKTGDLTNLGAYRWRVDQVVGPLSGYDFMAFTYREKTIYADTYIHTQRSAPASIQYNYDGGAYLSQVQSVFKSDDYDKGNYMRVDRFDVIDNGQTIRQYAITTGKKTWDACNKTYEVWQMNAIQEIGRDGTPMPADTFEHATLTNAPDGCYPYRRVWAVNTRYGGRVEIGHVSDGRYADGDPKHGYSYRVLWMRTYDGIHKDVAGLQYAQVTYQYGTACYDQTGTDGRPCQMSPDAEEAGPLAGHDWVTETVVDYDGDTVLGHNAHDYYICPDNNPANCTDWKIGRELLAQTYAADLATLLADVNTTWANAPFGNGTDFVYQEQVVSTNHTGGGSLSTKVTYAYDAYGNLTHTREYAHADDSTPYRTTRTDYIYNFFPLTWIVDKPQTVKVYAGDEDGTLLSWARSYYDYLHLDPPVLGMKGLLTKVEQINPQNPNEVVQTEYLYDPLWGNLIDTKDPLGNHSTVTYDPIYHVYPVQTCNALGQCTATEYYGVGGVAADSGLPGQIKSVTDPNGATTGARYDEYGRPIAIKAPDDLNWETGQVSTRFEYPNIGVVGLQRIITRSGRDATWQVELFDGLGRTIQVHRLADNGQAVRTSTQYDGLGRVVKEWTPYYGPQGEEGGYGPWGYVPPSGNRPHTTTYYDGLGRVVQVTHPDSTATSYLYYIAWNEADPDFDDGGRLAMIEVDANGHFARQSFDAFGRLETVSEFTGTWPASWGDEYRTRYTYDVLGNLTQVQDAADGPSGGNITTMEYDGLRRKEAMDDPDMGEWHYDYDLAGNLTSQMDAKGQTLTFEYDSLNRLIRESAGGQELAEYAYDGQSTQQFEAEAYSSLSGPGGPEYRAAASGSYVLGQGWGSNDRGRNAIWLMSGTTYAGEAELLPVTDLNWQMAGTGDFNKDGYVDILWRYAGGGSNQGRNVVWLMNGTTFAGQVELPTDTDLNWKIGGTGDFNGDGYVDILWRYYGSGGNQGMNTVWFMNGTTYVGWTQLLDVPDTNWEMTGTGDFNKDGYVDILWRYYGGGGNQGRNAIWLMIGTTFAGHIELPAEADLDWRMGGTGDFSGDGYVDILWRYYGSGGTQGMNTVWFMSGTTYVGWTQLLDVPDTNWEMTGTGDFSKDGYVDILWRYDGGVSSSYAQYDGKAFGWTGHDTALHLRYANGTGHVNVLHVYVDDLYKGDLHCGPTPGWGDAAADFGEAALNLGSIAPGVYSIKFVAAAPNSATNLDYFYFTDGQLGYRTGMEDGSGSTSWTYDIRGRMAREDKTVDSQTFTTRHTYDPLDRVMTMEYPGGEIVRNTYNAQGLPYQLGSDTHGLNYASEMQYNELGQILSMGLGNNLTARYFYDWDNFRLERAQVGVPGNLGSLLDLTYTYDDVGNVQTIADAINGNQVQHFTYDALDRLTHAWTTGGGNGAYDRSYAYDPIGNITHKDGMGDYTYDDPNYAHAVTHVDRDQATLPEGAVFHAPFNGDADDVVGGAQATTSGGVIYGDGKFDQGVQVAEATTNLVPNPSIETNTSGISKWQQNSSVLAQTRTTEKAKYGEHSLKCEFDYVDGVADTYFRNVDNSKIAVSASTDYAFTVWVYVDSYDAGATITARIWEYDDSGVYLKDTASSELAVSANAGRWLRVTLPVMTSADTAYVLVGVRVRNADAVFYIDAAQLEQKPYPTPYADGSLGDGHTWSGTPHNSTSSRDAATLSYATSDVSVDFTDGSQGAIGVWANLDDWDKHSGYVSAQVLDAHLDASNRLRVFAEQTTGVFRFLWNGNGNWDAHDIDVSSWTGWKHLVVTWDFSGGKRDVVYYVDGEQVQWYDDADPMDGNPTTLCVGLRYDGNHQWNGHLDDLTIFDRALSPEEITQLHDQGAGNHYTYDANGNMIMRVSGGITYTQEFDAKNKLVVVTNTVTSEVTTFAYDGDGNRVKKEDPSGTTYYVGGYYEKLVATGSVTETKYYYAGTQRIAMRQGSVVYYLHGDHLGSTSLTTNASGQEIPGSRTLYYLYGEVRYGGSGSPTDYGFTGQRKDSYLDTYSMGAREYDFRLGRWLSADTIVPEPGNPQSLNRYAYVNNNPLRYVDPSGHCSCPPDPRAYCSCPSPNREWLEGIYNDYRVEELYGWTFYEFAEAYRNGMAYAYFGSRGDVAQNFCMGFADSIVGPYGNASGEQWQKGMQWTGASLFAADAFWHANSEAAYVSEQLSGIGRYAGVVGGTVTLHLMAGNMAAGGPHSAIPDTGYPAFDFPEGDGHHTYPKALGGHPDQRLAHIPPSQHTGEGGIHPQLSEFEGGWLYPTRKMKGAMIVDKYGEQAIVDGLRRFYSQPEWSHLLPTFEAAVEFTRSYP